MFRKPVVFVVGAGASFEYGFPLGAKLKSLIAPKLRFRFEWGNRLSGGDHDLLGHLNRHVSDQEERNNFTRSANALADAMELFISIDEALHYVSETPQAVEIGKAAIASEILAAEASSSLASSKDNGRVRIDEQNGAWMAQMLSMAVAGLQKSELHLAFKNVTFVNFNYDRSLRHYMYNALQLKLGAEPELAKAVCESLKIFEPYGSLGLLEWQSPNGIRYGYDQHVDPFLLAKNMRTYTEQHLHESLPLMETITSASVIIFLGFGFHPQNVELLSSELPNRTVNIYGTAIGVHSGVQDAIIEEIKSKIGDPEHQPLLLGSTATDLLIDFRRRILFELS